MFIDFRKKKKESSVIELIHFVRIILYPTSAIGVKLSFIKNARKVSITLPVVQGVETYKDCILASNASTYIYFCNQRTIKIILLYSGRT